MGVQRRCGALLAVAAMCISIGWAPDASADTAKRACTVSDPRVDEASGIAVSSTDSHLLYVQNDSGDSARFFGVDARTGRTRAVYRVTGASAVDWEDIAVGPDAHGTSSVWLADIGDNGAVRPEVVVYRVDEPEASTYTGPDASAPVIDTQPAQKYRLRYPGGATDAEAIAVDQIRHHIYLTTKSISGHSIVYQLPDQPDPNRVQELIPVGSVQLSFTGTPGGPFAPVGQLTVTGAAMSADGSLFVLRTYTDAYLWRVTDGNVRAALRSPPLRMALPAQPQGEGITIQANTLLLDSEGRDSAVLSVATPQAVRAPNSSAHSTVPTTPSTSPSQPGGSHKDSGAGFGVVVLILAGAIAVFFGSRLRRKQQHRPEDTSWTG